MRRLILFAFAFFVASPHLLFAQTSTTTSTAPAMQSAYGRKIRIAGVRNAGKIDESLYRGSQPQLSAFPELKKLGVTTVVSLRAESPGVREREKAAAEKLGIRFVSIPVGGFATPRPDQVAQFLALFLGTHEKVFVHCHYGEDRTGVFVASYRIAVDRWPAQQALEEMNFFGFNRAWHPAMIRYVRDFPDLLRSAPALASLSGPGKAAAQPLGSSPN